MSDKSEVAPADGAATALAEPKAGRGVHLTERAAREILRVIAEQGFPATTWVRIGAKGGGCSGFTYVLDFDQNGPTEFDLGFAQHGVRFCVDKKSEFFMGGTTLDFNDGLLDRGFVFKNPQATGSCGCGTSFSA
jgi:iron-sulfur cluster assembly accessory protein